MAAYAPRKKKLEAIELLAAGLSYTQVASQVGVTQKTLRLWRKEPEFGALVLEKSRDLIKENLPDIYSVLIKEAKKGSHQHLRLVLEHIEKLEELRNTAEMGHISFTWKQQFQK